MPTNPTSFNDDAEAFISWQAYTFVPELNAQIPDVSAAADEAIAQAAAALSAVGAVQWVSDTTYAVGQCVWSPITHYSYRRKIAGAGTIDPSVDTTNWQKLNSGIAQVKSINGESLEGTGDIVVDTIPFGAF
jgi:hypothetical protein